MTEFGMLVIKDKVDVGDPGSDVVNAEIKVKAGKWRAYVETADGTIAKLIIRHEDDKEEISNTKRVACIGVDSGLAGFYPTPKPAYNDVEWKWLCEDVFNFGRNEEGFASYRDGVVAVSGYGDGWYDVFADYVDGEIVQLTIDFDVIEPRLMNIQLCISGEAREDEIEAIRDAITSFVENEVPKLMNASFYTEVEESEDN